MMQPDFPYLFLATVALTAFLCAHFSHALSLRVGLVDRPDVRKLHDGHIPLAGGPMVFAAFAIAALSLEMPVLVMNGSVAQIVLIAVIFMVGLLDDYVHLPPALRLGVQALCGLMMPVFGDVILHDLRDLLGFGPIMLGYAAVPLTALAFAGMVNAYNMIDGVDGLCATLALLPLLVVGVLAWQAGHPTAHALLMVTTALAVFLAFNLSSGTRWLPKLFLGDSGSGMLGFAVCSVLVYFSQPPQMLLKPVTCLWLVAVPLFDMLTTMLIRVREGHHPMRADRRHLHHLLMDRGFSGFNTRRIMISYAVVMIVAGFLLMPQSSYVSMAAILAVFATHVTLVCRARQSMLRALPDGMVNEAG